LSLPIGEMAALATAICWSITPVLFTLAGQKIGAINVNRVRILLALLFMLITHWLLFNTPLPSGISLENLVLLCLSGIIGLVIGDSMMYQSYLDIGPRKTLLLLTLAPVFSIVLAWIFLGETLNLIQILGILVTLSGIGLVILRQPDNNQKTLHNSKPFRGVLLASGAALSQAAGLILAKLGMNGDASPLSVSVIRMLAAFIVIWTIAVVRKQAVVSIRSLFQRNSSMKLIAGSFFGPFAGVTLSMIAINYAPVGIASTLMSISPVLLIPLSAYYLNDKSGIRGISGAALAVAGAAILLINLK